MPSHPEGKMLVTIVRQSKAASKLQRLWRKKWSRRTTTKLIERYQASYSRSIVTQMSLDEATTLFQKRDLQETRRLLAEDAKGFLRKPDAFFWMKKILARMVEKMRLRYQRTIAAAGGGGIMHRDFQVNCNPTYFIVAMPIGAKQTSLGQDAMCLLQSKELAVLHTRLWHTLEELMEKLVLDTRGLGALDQLFARLYTQFCVFSDLYRFTVLHAEGATAAKLESYILEHVNDLLLLEKDPVLKQSTFASIGHQLKRRIRSSVDLYAKRIKLQHGGDRRYRFFEQGELRAKRECEEPPSSTSDASSSSTPPLPHFQFFLAPLTDRTAVYELVHHYSKEPSFASKYVQQPIFQSQYVRQLYERDMYTRLRAEHTLDASVHRPVALEATHYIQTALKRLLPRVPLLCEEFVPMLEERRAVEKSKAFVNSSCTTWFATEEELGAASASSSPFDKNEAYDAFQFLFRLLRQMRQRIYFHAQTPVHRQLTQQRLDQEQREWGFCFQQKSVTYLSYVSQTQKLMDMLNHLVPSMTSLCVKVEMAPFGTNTVEYGRARVAASIQTQYTMAWLAPYIRARLAQQQQQQQSLHISNEAMREILAEAVWGIVTASSSSSPQGGSDPHTNNNDHAEEEMKMKKSSMRSGAFVWPETFQFEKVVVYDLIDEIALLTQHTVAFRAIATYLGSSKSSMPLLRGMLEAKDRPMIPSALEDCFKEYAIPSTHADYLIPLIQVRQHQAHPEYQSVQREMLQTLKQTLVTPHDAVSPPCATSWQRFGGEKGFQTWQKLYLLLHVNYEIFSERYHHIAQTEVDDHQMLMTMVF